MGYGYKNSDDYYQNIRQSKIMYLPKSKYKEAKYTRGDYFTLPDNKLYTGWYFETYKEEFYTGKFPGKNNILLTKLNSEEKTNKLRFLPERVDESTLDRTKPTFKRYYIQDTRNKRIIEVLKETYYKFTSKIYIKGIEVEWRIKGPAETAFKGKYLYEGAESKNKKTIEGFNNLLPGLKDYIKDYKEFVE